MSEKQTEALRLADALHREWKDDSLNYDTALEASAELIRQQRKVEVLRAERDHARACYDATVKLLVGIHALLYPAPTTLPDGRVMVFRPKSLDPHDVLQELSDRIRALPDELEKFAAIQQAEAQQPATGERHREAQRLIDTLRTDARGGRSATVHDLDAAADLIEASLFAPAEPVAALVRSRRIRTPAHCAFDKKDHYSEWSDWEPCTLSYARAVTDPARDRGLLPLYEMLPLYTHPAPSVPDGYVLVPIEPTVGMLIAGAESRISQEQPTREHAVWAAMLAAKEGGAA